MMVVFMGPVNQKTGTTKHPIGGTRSKAHRSGQLMTSCRRVVLLTLNCVCSLGNWPGVFCALLRRIV